MAMWFKKESKVVSGQDLEATLLSVSNTYRILTVLKPRYIDNSTKYIMIVWIYLGTDNGYIITVEPFFEKQE